MKNPNVVKILSDSTSIIDNRIFAKILILYSDNTYEFVDLDGGWYIKPNDEKTNLSRGYECKDFIKFLDYQKCRYGKWTKAKTISYLRMKEKEFQKDEKNAHVIWTREESNKRYCGIFNFMIGYDDGDKLENHFKKEESQ